MMQSDMFSALEIILVIAVLGGLFLIHTRTRAGSLPLYIAVGILLLAIIAATKFIYSLIGIVLLLVLVCVALFWKLARSRRDAS